MCVCAQRHAAPPVLLVLESMLMAELNRRLSFFFVARFTAISTVRFARSRKLCLRWSANLGPRCSLALASMARWMAARTRVAH